MKTNTALMHHPVKERIIKLADVIALRDYKENRINKTLNAVVTVRGRANVLLSNLLSPITKAAVVIRLHDGAYLDPCDFAAYLHQTKGKVLV